MTSASKGAPVISRNGSGLPNRVILHGVEGVGKSSVSAFAPKPVFSMTRGETGLLTLIDNGLVGPTDHFEECQTWSDLLTQINWLTQNESGHKVYSIDTLNGAERLCFEHVMSTKFGGDPEKFLAYGKGPEVSQGEWLRLLTALDHLRSVRKLGIMLLCHTKIKGFKNPVGDDFDRYTPDLHEKIWGLTHKWADVVLFANFETFAHKERGAMKAKGIGGGRRVFYAERTAAYDAKNRLGLPPEIPMDDAPDGGWRAFANAMRQARASRAQVQQTQQQQGVETNETVPAIAGVES